MGPAAQSHGATVQLIPAAAAAAASASDVYTAHHAAYLHADAVHPANDSEPAPPPPVIQLTVDPKSAAAALHYAPVDASGGYHVISTPSAGDGSPLSYALPAGDTSHHLPPSHVALPASQLAAGAGGGSRLYEDTPPPADYYAAASQSTVLVTSLHPASTSRSVLPGTLRQPLPLIISGNNSNICSFRISICTERARL